MFPDIFIVAINEKGLFFADELSTCCLLENLALKVKSIGTDNVLATLLTTIIIIFCLDHDSYSTDFVLALSSFLLS